MNAQQNVLYTLNRMAIVCMCEAVVWLEWWLWHVEHMMKLSFARDTNHIRSNSNNQTNARMECTVISLKWSTFNVKTEERRASEWIAFDFGIYIVVLCVLVRLIWHSKYSASDVHLFWMRKNYGDQSTALRSHSSPSLCSSGRFVLFGRTHSA